MIVSVPKPVNLNFVSSPGSRCRPLAVMATESSRFRMRTYVRPGISDVPAHADVAVLVAVFIALRYAIMSDPLPLMLSALYAAQSNMRTPILPDHCLW